MSKQPNYTATHNTDDITGGLRRQVEANTAKPPATAKQQQTFPPPSRNSQADADALRSQAESHQAITYRHDATGQYTAPPATTEPEDETLEPAPAIDDAPPTCRD